MKDVPRVSPPIVSILSRLFRVLAETGTAQQGLDLDPFCGHEYIARLSAEFITRLFRCCAFPPHITSPGSELPYFIAYTLRCTQLPPSAAYGALLLLQRLRFVYPNLQARSGHCLFLAAVMISAKFLCDDTYSNEAWRIAAQEIFPLHEINRAEREMCWYLNWKFFVNNSMLVHFETAVRDDFDSKSSEPHPWPHLETPAPVNVSHTTTAESAYTIPSSDDQGHRTLLLAPNHHLSTESNTEDPGAMLEISDRAPPTCALENRMFASVAPAIW